MKGNHADIRWSRPCDLSGASLISACAVMPELVPLGDEFLAASESYEAVDPFSDGLFSFGEYIVVSADRGATHSSSDREFLGSERTGEWSRNSDFVLEGPRSETVRAEISHWVREVYYDRAIFNDNQLEERADTTFAEFRVGPDSTLWRLELVTREGTVEFVPEGFERAHEALSDYSDLSLERLPHLPVASRALDLWQNMAAADAVYVGLAEALRLPLVTSDKRLARAAREQTGLEVLEV